MIIMLLVDGIITVLSLRQNYYHQVRFFSLDDADENQNKSFLDLSINPANKDSFFRHDHSIDHCSESSW